MRLLIFLAIYILSIFITRWFNYLTVKYNNDDKIIGMWFIPVMNIVTCMIMSFILIQYWYKHSSKNRFLKSFFGENWKPHVIDPDDERKLENIDVRTIEQYLRKKKLKKLK
jgi:hypothetical protein